MPKMDAELQYANDWLLVSSMTPVTKPLLALISILGLVVVPFLVVVMNGLRPNGAKFVDLLMVTRKSHCMRLTCRGAVIVVFQYYRNSFGTGLL
jgi:putative effector of murein hydrolase LrgA (UPF0299 family)